MATAESINNALEGALAPIEAQKKNLKATYEQQRKNLETDLQAQTDAIRRARDQALNEAYIVHRTQQRQLPQVLAAQGRTGGAVQSTVADITNEYQRSRRAAEGDYNLAHGDLQLQYNKNLGNLELDYGNDLNELDAQIAAARASAAAQLAELRARELEASRSGSGSDATYTIAKPVANPSGGISYVPFTGTASQIAALNAGTGSASMYMKGTDGYAYTDANRQKALEEERKKYGSQYGTSFNYGKNNAYGVKR